MGDIRFVVTGCQRSGTLYTAVVMRELGISCGHEFFFRPGAECDLGPPPPRGDASWCAAPYLHRLPPGTLVFHQVRHPLSVIRSSLARTTIFNRRARGVTRRFKAFMEGHCPDAATGDRVSRCLSYWVSWNRMIESKSVRAGLPYMRYRIEEMGSETVREMLSALSENPPADLLDDVLRSVPKDTNQKRVRHRPSLDIAWADVPDGELKQRAEMMALLYGYTA